MVACRANQLGAHRPARCDRSWPYLARRAAPGGLQRRGWLRRRAGPQIRISLRNRGTSRMAH